LAHAFLKAYAADSGVSIELIDFFLNQDAESCATFIVASQPVAVGFSLYVWNRELCSRIAAELRRMQPDIVLFCGGPEATADSGNVLQEGIFDFLFIGEGESAFLQFCRHIAAGEKIHEVPGIVSKGMKLSTPVAPLTDLDSIPSPYLSGVINSEV
jgi:radical SAM superfamily enzyme YgiQ (UPF0313 family)